MKDKRTKRTLLSALDVANALTAQQAHRIDWLERELFETAIALEREREMAHRVDAHRDRLEREVSDVRFEAMRARLAHLKG